MVISYFWERSSYKRLCLYG